MFLSLHVIVMKASFLPATEPVKHSCFWIYVSSP